MINKPVKKDESGAVEKFLKKIYQKYGNSIAGKILIAFIWLLISPFLIFAVLLISLDLFYAPYKLTREIFYIVNDYDLELLEDYNKNTKYNLGYFRGWQFWISVATSTHSFMNIFLFLFTLFFLDNRKEILRLFYIVFQYICKKKTKAASELEIFLRDLKYTAADIRIARRDRKRKPGFLLRGVYCIIFGFCYIFLIKLIPLPEFDLMTALSTVLEWIKYFGKGK